MSDVIAIISLVISIFALNRTSNVSTYSNRKSGEMKPSYSGLKPPKKD